MGTFNFESHQAAAGISTARPPEAPAGGECGASKGELYGSFLTARRECIEHDRSRAAERFAPLLDALRIQYEAGRLEPMSPLEEQIVHGMLQKWDECIRTYGHPDAHRWIVPSVYDLMHAIDDPATLGDMPLQY